MRTIGIGVGWGRCCVGPPSNNVLIKHWLSLPDSSYLGLSDVDYLGILD